MSQSFSTFYNNIDYVEVDDNTFSLYQNRECMMVLPKYALSVMTMNYDNILLDFEEQYERGRKYWSDEDTIIYMKNILDKNGTSSRDTIIKVFCILQVPFEVVLTKEAFQSMLIMAAVACRIKADNSHRTPNGLEYELNSSKSIILHDSQTFSIADESRQIKFEMPMKALAKMVMDRNEILCDLRDDNYFGKTVYWYNRSYRILSEYFRNFRVLCFVIVFEDGDFYIRMRDRTFESMIHIATGGPPFSDGMDDRMWEVRDIYWNSIPINTVKSIEFSRDRGKFTLINEVNGDTLTLSVKALKAAQKYKRHILCDLDDERFQPTYEKDYMNEYWTDDVYAMRTGVFYNLQRNIDCNVVRFTRLKDNYYKFVLQKQAFLWLLDQ